MQSYTETAGQAYAFLSQPPPPPPSNSNKMSENMRRRSTTISAWASTVQPGPPAPISPSRLEFPDVRTSRRKSHTAAPTSSFPAPPSPVAYIPTQDSPTSSSHSITPALKQDAKHDLPSVGYTSIFVTLPPKTPPVEYTPDRRRSVSAVPRAAAPSAPPTPTAAASKGFLRGLSIKHARSKSTAGGEDAAAPKSKPAKEKKAKYPDARPPQISTDLALAQFMGGGKIEHHMKQQAKAQAKAAGAARVDGQLVGVGALHRDGRGGVWRDPDEELEYAGLLDGAEGEEDAAWVRFEQRRGGEAVRPSMDSLDPRYAMHAEVDPLDASLASGRHARRSADYPPSSSAGAGRSRRRPEPLTLVPEDAYHRGHALNPADARREFLESSFDPPAKPAVSGPHPSAATADSNGTKKSMLKGLFKSKKPSRA